MFYKCTAILTYLSSITVQNILRVDKKAIGERVKALRTRQKLSQEKFGDSLGVSRSAINQMEKGQISPSIELMGRMVEKYSITYDSLLSDTNLSASTQKGIPFYDVPAIAGPMTTYNDLREYVVDYLHFPGYEDFSDCDFCVKASGDSMLGKFNPGDYLLCKVVKDRTLLLPGETYYLITSEFKTVKYVFPRTKDGVYLLKSENELFEDFEVAMDKVFMIAHVKGAASVHIKRIAM